MHSWCWWPWGESHKATTTTAVSTGRHGGQRDCTDRERSEDYFKRERKDCIKDGVRKATDTFRVLQILEHQNRYVLKQSFALYHPSCDSLFFKPEVSDGIAATMTNKKELVVGKLRTPPNERRARRRPSSERIKTRDACQSRKIQSETVGNAHGGSPCCNKRSKGLFASTLVLDRRSHRRSS